MSADPEITDAMIEAFRVAAPQSWPLLSDDAIAAGLHAATGSRPSGAHSYLSTGCYHGEHDYCRSMTGWQGEKRPAQCKFCDARCECDCHREEFGLMVPLFRREPGRATAPSEAGDSAHPDHDWWVEGSGRCLASDCDRHSATPASAGEPKATSKEASDLDSTVEPVVPEEPRGA